MNNIGTHVPYWRLSGFYFFYFAFLGALIPYWGLYLESQGFDAVSIGQLTAIVLFTKVVSPLLWSWVSRRTSSNGSLSKMSIVRIGALASLIFLIGLCFQPSFWPLAACIFGFSFFRNAILPEMEAITLGFVSSALHQYARIRLWGSVGFILLVVILGVVFDYLSLSLLPLILLLLGLFIWISTLLVANRNTMPETSVSVQSFWLVLKRPQVIAFLSVAFLMQLSHGPYYTFYTIHLNALGYEKFTIGIMWSVGVLAEVVLFYQMHKLLSVYRARQVFIGSILLSALRWFMIGKFADSMLLLFLAQLLHAASYASFHAICVQYIHKHFSGNLEGQGQALYSSVSFGLGGALGALYVGHAWESMGAASSFVLASLCCLLAALIAWKGVNFESKYNKMA